VIHLDTPLVHPDTPLIRLEDHSQFEVNKEEEDALSSKPSSQEVLHWVMTPAAQKLPGWHRWHEVWSRTDPTLQDLRAPDSATALVNTQDTSTDPTLQDLRAQRHGLSKYAVARVAALARGLDAH
jgi:hypothetical protein